MATIRQHRHEGFRWLRSNGIRQAACDAFERFLQCPGTLQRPSLILRCQRTDGEFTCRVVVDKPLSHPRLEKCFLPFLRRLEHRSRGACDFFVLVSDNLYVAEASRAEFLHFLERIAFLRCDRYDEDEISGPAILIPDFNLQEPIYAEELASVEKAAAATDFDSRIEVIKWRGRLSGPDYPTLENCGEFPRYVLLMLSLQHPDVIDARLTTYKNLVGSESALALRQQLERRFGSPADKLPAAGFVPYKYLASLDGAVAAWKRVPTSLAAGSVLLLQHRWSQFFYPGMQPWEHYVPLKPDISDILERYAWLREQPAVARAIADNGRRFAAEVLRPQALDDYFVEILDACSMLYS